GRPGKIYGLLFSAAGTGRAELSLYFSPEAAPETKRLFVALIEEHLRTRGRQRNPARKHARACPACRQPMSGATHNLRLTGVSPSGATLNFEYIAGADELTKVFEEEFTKEEIRRVREIDQQIDYEKRLRARDYDVFVSYCSLDQTHVLHVA